MSDRRQAQRFALSNPAHAQLHLAQDVVIERSEPGSLTVLAPASSMAGDQFAIRLRAFDGRMATVPVRTRASRLVLLDGGSVRYRLDLDVLAGEGGAPPAAEMT
jgi:hypothetical protein